MKKLAALLSATMMINLLATSNFGLSAGAFGTEQTNEYEVTEDVTIVEVDEEIADEPMTMSTENVRVVSHDGKEVLSIPYEKNLVITQASNNITGTNVTFSITADNLQITLAQPQDHYGRDFTGEWEIIETSNGYNVKPLIGEILYDHSTDPYANMSASQFNALDLETQEIYIYERYITSDLIQIDFQYAMDCSVCGGIVFISKMKYPDNNTFYAIHGKLDYSKSYQCNFSSASTGFYEDKYYRIYTDSAYTLSGAGVSYTKSRLIEYNGKETAYSYSPNPIWGEAIRNTHGVMTSPPSSYIYLDKELTIQATLPVTDYNTILYYKAPDLTVVIKNTSGTTLATATNEIAFKSSLSKATFNSYSLYNADGSEKLYNSNADGTGVAYTASTLVEDPTDIYSNLTLYLMSANYVTYTNVKGELVTVPVIAGQTMSEPTGMEKDGYEFAGFFIDEECTIPYDFSTAVNSDITLYPKWEKTVEIYDTKGNLIDTVIVDDVNEIIQLDAESNDVKITTNLEQVDKIIIENIEVDNLYYVSGWETYSDNGNVYITPIISEKPYFTIKDAGGNVLEKVVIEPGTSLDITQYSYEAEVVKSGAITSDGQSFQLESAEKIDGLVFVEWEYVTDDDGNIDVYPIYKEAISVGVYSPNGELIGTVETVVGGNVLLTNPAVDDEKIDEIDNSGSYYAPQADDLDDLIFSHYEVGTDDKYNVTLEGVYVPAGTLVLYEADENGEFVDTGMSKKLPIGDEYYQVDSEGNVVGSGIIGSGENAFELVPADELSGYIHVGWEFETDENGATVIKPTYVKQTSNSGPITVTTPSTSGTSGGSSSSNGTSDDTSSDTSGETNENDSKNPSYGEFDDENGDDFDPFNDIETSETSGDADFGNDDDDMVNDGADSDGNPDENDGNPSDEPSSNDEKLSDNSSENSNSVKPENHEETYGVAGGTDDDDDRESSGTIVPKTSDTATFGAWIAMMFTAMFGMVLVNRKKQF